MLHFAVLAISITLQLTAVWLAIRMAQSTGKWTGWLLLTAALVLMAVRRGITLGRSLVAGGAIHADPAAELVALLISGLMVAGIATMGSLLYKLKQIKLTSLNNRWLQKCVAQQSEQLQTTTDDLNQESRQRQIAERELQTQEQMFRTFMDHSPAVAFMKDAEGRYVYVNEPLQQRFRFMIDGWIGRTDEELWPEDIAWQFRRRDRLVYQENEPVRLAEITPAEDGGVTHWVSLKFPFQDDAGNWYLGGMAIDVTELEETKEQLRKTEEQFLQSQKMEAVGRLAGGIAHDFNNLLTIINGYSGMLLEDLSESDPSREMVEPIQDAGERAAGLTRQLLLFSRREVSTPEVLSLNDVIQNTEKMLRRLIGEDVELTTLFDPSLGTVKADPGQMEQIVMNLAVNARDAMPQGGQVTIETSNVELDEAFADDRWNVRPGSYVLLTISDTGRGMDQETQKHIFEPFFTTKEEGQGTGLGLSTIFGIVQECRGYVGVYSEPDDGTTFRVYIPRVEEHDAQPIEEEAPQLAAVGQETVLLAEDDLAVRRLARHVLRKAGYTVLETENGKEAIRIAKEHPGPIHLLLTDVVMPEIDGPALTERVTQSRPSLPVLYMSGYTDDTVVRRGILQEDTPFLQKPFTPEALKRKVREVLDASCLA